MITTDTWPSISSAFYFNLLMKYFDEVYDWLLRAQTNGMVASLPKVETWWQDIVVFFIN